MIFETDSINFDFIYFKCQNLLYKNKNLKIYYDKLHLFKVFIHKEICFLQILKIH